MYEVTNNTFNKYSIIVLKIHSEKNSVITFFIILLPQMNQ